MTGALRVGYASATVALAIVLAGGCEKLAPNRIGSGLGTRCAADTDCQASKCVTGICAIPCSPSCPSGTLCAQAICQVPLNVGLIYPGSIAQEAYTNSFDQGRLAAATALPYTSLAFTENVSLAMDVAPAVDTLLGQGRTVILGAASFPSYGPILSSYADDHPKDTFLIAGSRITRPNLISFDVRTYQAYFLAGIAAARKTVTHRLGMIGSTYSPPTVASINAFALGAQSINPLNIVELDWMGDRHDTNPPVGQSSRERVFTEQLVAHGADVIAHTLDNNKSVATISEEAPPGVFAIAADVVDACDQTQCLGTVYYNWGPMFESLLDSVHKQTLAPGSRILESIKVSSNESVVGFRVSDQIVGSTAIATEVDAALFNLAQDQGVGRVFDGPIHSAACEASKMVPTCVAAGARLDDQGLDTMCWLVDGIVTRSAGGVDMPATVPMDPNQDCGMIKP